MIRPYIAQCLLLLSRAGSLSYHTYCDTGHLLSTVSPEGQHWYHCSNAYDLRIYNLGTITSKAALLLGIEIT